RLRVLLGEAAIFSADTGVELPAEAHVQIHMAASAYYLGKPQKRETSLAEKARLRGCPTLFLNHIGGQDEPICDGGALLVGPDGSVLERFTRFEEDFRVLDVDIAHNAIEKTADVSQTSQKYALNAPTTTP